MNSPEWIQFRNTCACRRHDRGNSDMCCTVDDAGKIAAHHGDCVQENCPANWKKILANRGKRYEAEVEL